MIDFATIRVAHAGTVYNNNDINNNNNNNDSFVPHKAPISSLTRFVRILMPHPKSNSRSPRK